jgi:hypothetical protein
VLVVMTSLLMAYVVTNYGTLFRLRLLSVVPLWVLPLAVLRAEGFTPRQKSQEPSSRAHRDRVLNNGVRVR